MPHHLASETAVSAPGKVLLTGGYLVLDRQYTGSVYALDARIHVIVQQLKKDKDGKISKKLSVGELQVNNDNDKKEGENGDGADGAVPREETGEVVIVRSPQFVDALWEYRVTRVSNGGGIKVVQLNDVPRNPFVETSLNYALTYINCVAASKSFGSLSVTILADNDYYSETAASINMHTSPGMRFKKFGVRLHEAHKTGLGSSAALVTALVSALVIHRTVHPESMTKNKGKLHNLAQAAHCAAQGKVGSGFDVAAAIYGSCIYRRFSPAVLSSLGDIGSPQFEDRLFAVVENVCPVRWDAHIREIGSKLPRGLQLVLCDVDCGSQTPGMVKQVLAWREADREKADRLWNALQRQNDLLCMELHRLAHTENPERDFSDVRDIILGARNLIQQMTAASRVPIEPKVQTELLDELSNLDGVIGGVVPGAGGYDAIALLVRDEKDVAQRLNAFVQDYVPTVEDDFGGKIGKVRLLGVTHGYEGTRNEMPSNYAEWL